MTYSRGRVAFTVPDALGSPASLDGTWHVGHARTLYLGYLHCLDLGIPFDVRLDGCRIKTEDSSGAVVDLCNLLSFLEVRPRRVYWQPQESPDPAYVHSVLGVRADDFLTALSMPAICPDWYAAVLCDDILDNHPSLIIRGQEFVEPARWCSHKASSTAMANHTAFENVCYNSAGREKHELTLPLFTAGGYKLSKSSGTVPHWSVLTMAPAQVACMFIEDLGYDNYEWSWERWTNYTKNK
jgi:hypothetical protein